MDRQNGRRRTEEGSYHAVGQVEVIARTLLETIAFWALHRHFDPAPQQVDDTVARPAVLAFLARGLLEGRA